MIYTLFPPPEMHPETFNDETGNFSVRWKKELDWVSGELRDEDDKLISRLVLHDDGKLVFSPLKGYANKTRQFLVGSSFYTFSKGPLQTYAEKQLKVLQRVSSSFDSEKALHDYRIGLRKTRTILSAFSLGLGKKQRAFYKATCKHLGKLTSSIRDADVMYARLTKDANETRVLETLLKRREDARTAFTTFIHDTSYTLMLDRWEEVIHSSILCSVPYDLASAVENQKIRLHRAVEAADRSKEEHIVHQVRKEVKKLRYLREILALDASFPLEKVQDLLGSYHDLGMLQQYLFRFLKQYKKQIPHFESTHLLQLVVAYEGERTGLLDQYRSLVVPLLEV